jgi:hypothetical protein
MRFSKSRALFALLAVLVVSAVTVSAASAATTPEFSPVPAKKKFTASSSGVTAEWSGGAQYVCSKSSTSGEVTGARTVGDVLIVWGGCMGKEHAGAECSVHSEGAKAGEIVFKPMGGELGTVASTEAKSGVGLMLQREVREKEKGKGLFALEGTCLTTGAFSGSFAGEVTVVGSKVTVNDLSFQAPGTHQEIRKITLDSGTKAEPEFVMGGGLIHFEWLDELGFEEALEVT